MSNVNYREYNDLHLPIADNLVCFMKGVKHAMQKTKDPDGAMKQLKCIGYDKALATVESVAHVYKAYHKQRIYAEQTAESLDVRYPKIQKDRRSQYDKNCQLIRELRKLQDCTARTEDLRCAITEELDVDIAKVLDAYLSCDVDALISAITGWDLEALMAAARIIPDLKGWFPSREVNTDEIAFPLYEKEVLSETEFKDFLRDAYEIHMDTWAMIENAIAVAKRTFKKDEDRADFLRHMLDGVLSPMPEEAIRIVRL